MKYVAMFEDREMKKKFDKNTSLIIIISLILLLLNVGFGIMFLSKSRETVKSIIYNRMMSISSIAASIIDGDDLESITQEDVDNKTEKYTKIYDTLSSFQSNNQNQFKYIYSIRDNGDKTFSFIIDPDTESPGEFGEEIVYTDALYQASLGTSSIDKTASEDRWGSFYSAFTPVFDSQGKVAGIIGIDFEIN